MTEMNEEHYAAYAATKEAALLYATVVGYQDGYTIGPLDESYEHMISRDPEVPDKWRAEATFRKPTDR